MNKKKASYISMFRWASRRSFFLLGVLIVTSSCNRWDEVYIEDFSSDDGIIVSRDTNLHVIRIPNYSTLPDTNHTFAEVTDGDLLMVGARDVAVADMSRWYWPVYGKVDAFVPLIGMNVNQSMQVEVRFKNGLLYAFVEGPSVSYYESCLRGTRVSLVHDGHLYSTDKTFTEYDWRGSVLRMGDTLTNASILFRFDPELGWSLHSEPEIFRLEMLTDTSGLEDGILLEHYAGHYNFRWYFSVLKMKTTVDWIRMSMR